MRKESRRWSAFARLAISSLLVSTCRAFVEFPYNKNAQYGPDGPWQAVSLGVKYPGDDDFTTIDVYPSVLYDTIAALYIPTTAVCSKYNYADCATGGTIGSLAYTNGSSWYTYFNTKTSFYFYLNGSTAYTDLQFPNNIQMSSALTDVLKAGEMTYPSGITLPIEVGYGCLGGNPLTQSMNAPLSLYNGQLTTSNSFGLHIGSAPLGYTGSLVFGGYNRGRVIGPVITYDASQTITLIDIEIGVEEGDSPFDFDMQTDLLVVPPSSGFSGSLPVLAKPEYPYIYVNKETLNNIVQHLPVSFDSGAGFYLWDTTNPLYKQIVSLPAYLGFVFPSVSGNTANTTIKIPFKLLNLTLEAAASGLDSDRAYLPLMETDVGGDLGLDILLGRAFLQGAFMGTNWAYNKSFLAQAPGPGGDGEGLGYDPVDLSYAATTLDVQNGEDLFKQSWAGHWTVIDKSSNDGGNGNDSGGLSGGAIGGIVGGVVGGVVIIGALLAFCLVRRKRKARETASQHTAYSQPGMGAPNSPGQQFHQQPYGQQPYSQNAYFSDKPQQPHEMHGDAFSRQEMDGQNYYDKANKPPGVQERYEMSANIHNVGELPGHEPSELPANPRTV